MAHDPSAFVRSACLDDLIGITEVEARSFEERLRWTDEDLRSEIEQGRVLVWSPDGQWSGHYNYIGGYAVIEVRTNVGTLRSVGVVPENRQSGIGAALVNAAVARAYRQGANCVELDCDENLFAFYHRLGFSICGFYTSGVGEDEARRLVMRHVPMEDA